MRAFLLGAPGTGLARAGTPHVVPYKASLEFTKTRRVGDRRSMKKRVFIQHSLFATPLAYFC